MNNILTTTQTDSASGKSLGIQAAEDTPILSLKLNIDRVASLPNCSTHFPLFQWNKDSSWSRWVLLSALCLTSLLWNPVFTITSLLAEDTYRYDCQNRTAESFAVLHRSPWHPVVQFYIGGIPRTTSPSVPSQNQASLFDMASKGRWEIPS